MTAVTAFGIAVTVGAYCLSLWTRKRFPSPLTSPGSVQYRHRHRGSPQIGHFFLRIRSGK